MSRAQTQDGPDAARFVLFPLGKRRYALEAGIVTELARPDRLQSFPHTTPLFSGVLLRRGHIVPVCDIAPALVGAEAPARKFYLIAVPSTSAAGEWTAIPVSGECELLSCEMLPATGKVPAYVSGVLSVDHETVEVIDLERLIAAEARS